MDWLDEKRLRNRLENAERKVAAYEVLLEKRLHMNEKLTREIVRLGGDKPPWYDPKECLMCGEPHGDRGLPCPHLTVT